jgi:hypothetical protein
MPRQARHSRSKLIAFGPKVIGMGAELIGFGPDIP